MAQHTLKRERSTRDRLIQAALELFQAQGYYGTSVDDILEEAGAHPGSFYYHFESKSELLIEALEQHRDRLMEQVIEPAWAGIDDPIERIYALLHAYRKRLIESEFRYASPVGALAAELRGEGPLVLHKLAQNFTVWRRAVEHCLEQASARIPSNVDHAQLAGFVLTTLEGAVMLARAYRDPAAFDAGVARLRDYLARLEATARAEPR